MRRLIIFFLVVIPPNAFSQLNVVKSSPLDYMWKYVGNQGFSAGDASYTSLAFSPNGDPYVAYEDGGNSYKSTVMKFDGTNWVNVGNAGFSAGQALCTSLALSSSGEPYVAFIDAGNSGKATVMKFDGSNWVNVGNAGFSAGMIGIPSLAFSLSGEPYVAYGDKGNSSKETVMKFNGNNWVNVGTAGFSAGSVDFTSLAFSPFDSLPYVAYQDYYNSRKATVMKFNGTAWVNVGNAGFSSGQSWYTSLAINQSGQPFVAYQDWGNYYKATVMKFDGSNWMNVGNAGFTADTAICTSLAINQSGEPYVAFMAYKNDYYNQKSKASVMRFNGINWINVGIAGFSAGRVYYTNLAFSPANTPHIVYSDGEVGWKVSVLQFDSVYVGINEQLRSKINCYPNPSNTRITFDIVDKCDIPKVLNIFTICGDLIYENSSSNCKIELNIENFPAGIYIVKLITRNSTYETKFIKD